jgi:uncharacterized protein YndB with AHSA1/START domain
MYTTRVTRRIAAPASEVYAALVDADAVARWRVPRNMTATVHEFDARVGGRVRISLTYDDLESRGKTSAHTDTYSGRFLELTPDVGTVEEVEFESTDAALAGTVTVTTRLTPDGDGTMVEFVQEGMPDAVPPADNELGSRMALDALAEYVEGRLRP